MTVLLLALLASAPALEAEIDSQTREDDELPPSSVLPYTPHFDGKTLPDLVCGPEVKDASVKKLLQDGTRLTDSKDLAEVKRAVPKLQRALELDPKAGGRTSSSGSAHAKLGDPVSGTRAYETYLLSCRTYPNADRVQRILTDYWRATGGKGDPRLDAEGNKPAARLFWVAACPCDAGSRISRMRALLMRLTLLLPLLLVATACNKTLVTRPPLLRSGSTIRPASPSCRRPADGGVGRIYVASSNFDRRFENGWVTSIDLSLVRSRRTAGAFRRRACRSRPPPDGGSDQGRPVQFTYLATDGGSIVLTDSFAGIATVDTLHNRLFVPTRSAGELDELAVMDMTPDGGPSLSCYFSGGTDCTQDAIQVALEQTPGDLGLPRRARSRTA